MKKKQILNSPIYSRINFPGNVVILGKLSLKSMPYLKQIASKYFWNAKKNNRMIFVPDKSKIGRYFTRKELIKKTHVSEMYGFFYPTLRENFQFQKISIFLSLSLRLFLGEFLFTLHVTSDFVSWFFKFWLRSNLKSRSQNKSAIICN